MISENILGAFIGFGIVILLYIAITQCVNSYQWRKLKRHVIEAIESLNLWNAVNTQIPVNVNVFQSIIKFLNAYKYTHCFYGNMGTFKFYSMLTEIRNEHERRS